MKNFYKISNKNNILRRFGRIDLFRPICVVLISLLILQVFSPGVAFCLKQGSRVIQCRSILASPSLPVVNEVVETGCCNKSCREKQPSEAKTHSPSADNDKNCCISLHIEHEGVICLSHSDIEVPECAVDIDPVKSLFNTTGFSPNCKTEKPPSLVFIRSVVLIL
jgi:hypothetical protein